MSSIKYVSTREELKSALEKKYDYIIITDKSLAGYVSVIKNAKEGVLTAAIVATAGAVTMWWNPIGWASGVVALTTGGALTLAVAFLIVALGVAVLWALYREWNIAARGTFKLPDGTTVTGEIILTPNR
ncbi:MAG: hypothetical protein WCF67_21835 [Chitinophagaceae bacterium]